MPHYKVVRNDSGNYYSAQIENYFRVTYFVEQWVRGELGWLFIFKTQQAAEDFIGATPGDLEVWECSALNVQTPSLVLQDADVSNATENSETLAWYKSFWENAGYAEGYDQRRVPGRSLRAPDGTLMAEAVKLERKVAP